MNGTHRAHLSAITVAALSASSAVAGTATVSDGFEAVGRMEYTNERAHLGSTSLKSDPASDARKRGAANTFFTGVADGEVSLWFYDDMGGCSNNVSKSQVAFIQTGAGGASTAMLGVITNNSPCNYSRRVGTTYATTNIARSLGWHEYRFAWSGSSLTLSIDGQVAFNGGYPFLPDSISYGDVWAETVWTGIGAGWYDDVSIRLTTP
ncbi:hypothetical protein [Hyalangium versicolor]|uniref:hypothetical protein n=1 Tax=Hyalangium versicolor TaxID=2861190 RepID=UPI001CCB55CF|nr:hypothetical protein [Hyalangium versicolor]